MGDYHEQRRWQRTQVERGFAVSFGAGQGGRQRALVDNISNGGVSAFGPPPTRRGYVDLTFEFASVPRVTVRGRVVRHLDRAGKPVSWAADFKSPCADLLASALLEVLLSHPADGTRGSVALHADGWDQHHLLATALLDQGHPLLLARTPTDLFNHMIDTDNDVSLALIDPEACTANPHQLAGAITDSFPGRPCCVMSSLFKARLGLLAGRITAAEAALWLRCQGCGTEESLDPVRGVPFCRQCLAETDPLPLSQGFENLGFAG